MCLVRPATNSYPMEIAPGSSYLQLSLIKYQYTIHFVLNYSTR
jgi:hypothetical protein